VGRAWLGNKRWGAARGWYSAKSIWIQRRVGAAATIVTDDPIFGLLRHGRRSAARKIFGSSDSEGWIADALSHCSRRAAVHILLERDGFAKDKAISFDDRGDSLSFELENRGGGDHETTIRISGLTRESMK